MADEQSQLADLVRELTSFFGDPEEPADELPASSDSAEPEADESKSGEPQRCPAKSPE